MKWILVFIPYLGNEYTKIQDYREVKVYQCPSFPRDGVGDNGYSNADQTVDYVVNAWDMDNPSLTSGDKGEQTGGPTKLGKVKSPAERIYLADNEAGDWRRLCQGRSSDGPDLCPWHGGRLVGTGNIEQGLVGMTADPCGTSTWRRRESNPHSGDATAVCSRYTTSPGTIFTRILRLAGVKSTII